ncbi:AraC family transcriptional regulator [uncultured Sphaerochaeta sp.]|uniref:AraC family transcriptional regulator n=1 Tax=uncultured Sphaerochaeta sp. TaxID=886478 RepID=UPI002A0A5ED2|nr:AraC family transcriptional regulator [uncultured Sphaerochaeta sp.]
MRKQSVTRSWLLKIFIPIISIVLVAMISLALVFSTLFTDVAQSIIVDDFLASLRMISTYYRQMRFSTVPIIDDLSDATEIRNYLLANVPKEQATLGVYARLENTVARNSYIHSIYLYNQNYGFFSSLNGVESSDNISDSTLLSFLDQQPRNKHLYQRQSIFSNKTIPLSLPRYDDAPTNLYSICNLSYDEQGNLRSGIVMNLSETAARNILASDDSNTMKNFYMIDEDFFIISHPDPKQFGQRVTSQSLLGQIVLFPESSGAEVLNDINGDEFLACWYDVGEMNWRLIYILPMVYLSEPLVALRWNLVLVFLGLAILASLLLVWETRRVNNQLTREKRFIDFLKGIVGIECLPLYHGSSFQLILFHRQPVDRKEVTCDKEQFLAFASQYFSIDGKQTLLLQVERGLFVYLTLQDSSNIISQCKKMRIDMSDRYSENLSILYNQTRIGLEDLPQTYAKMHHSLRTQILVHAGFVRPIEQTDNKEVNLFLGETAEVSKALMQKSCEAYKDAVQLLMSSLKSQDDYELFGAMKLYLSYSIVGLIGDIFEASEEITAQEWKLLTLSSRNYDELQEGLLRVEQLLLDYKQQYSKRHNLELIQSMKHLVAEHLYDVNLSSTFIADKVELSLGYTRNVFKASEHMSLNDYIGTKRIEEACRLLTSTKQSINSIRESLGFSNTSYFCTYFKKIKGFSPSEFRRKQRVE